MGFGIDVMTWMGFGTHPSRLYEFFEHQELQFIYDSSDYYMLTAIKAVENIINNIKSKDNIWNVESDGEFS